MEAALLLLKGAVRFLGGIRACLWLAFALWFMWSAHSWKGAAHDQAEHAAKEHAAAEGARNKYADLQAQLADAKAAADRAVAEKAAAEKAAQKRLQAARKRWQAIYGAKPENKAWADAPIPPDVLGGLHGAE